MLIKENVSIKAFNTFGIDSKSRYLAHCRSVDDVQEAVEFAREKKNRLLVLGGGSNVLLTSDVDGVVLKPELEGIEVVKTDDQHVYVKVGAGVNWHLFVMYCVDENLGGVENLSLIPGNCGASPMQNIGAYGVEIKDVFHELVALNRNTGELLKFSNSDCEFGYRQSVFKSKYKDQYIILSVTYRLKKTPSFNTTYGAVEAELARMQVSTPSLRAVSDAIIHIRQSKLPDPAKIGNAGSFFKNPVITKHHHDELKKEFPSLVSFPAAEEMMKLAAGWLIESCGWKGYRDGDAGCYPLQALVLVNYGTATGQDIYDLSSQIIHSVQEKFQVTLEREVNII